MRIEELLEKKEELEEEIREFINMKINEFRAKTHVPVSAIDIDMMDTSLISEYVRDFQVGNVQIHLSIE